MELSKIEDSIFKMSKKDIQKRVKAICDIEKEHPFFDPLEIFVASKRAVEFFQNITDNIKDEALKEAQKYGAESLVKFDAKIDVGSTYTTYDFSVCQDEEYNTLLNQKAEIDAKLKEKEKFLKALTKPLTSLDKESGEVITIYPPVKKTTDGLKITY